MCDLKNKVFNNVIKLLYDVLNSFDYYDKFRVRTLRLNNENSQLKYVSTGWIMWFSRYDIQYCRISLRE